MVDKYDVSTVHTILCAAAPLGKETAEAVEKRLGYKNMRQGMFLTYLGPSHKTGGFLFLIVIRSSASESSAH